MRRGTPRRHPRGLGGRWWRRRRGRPRPLLPGHERRTRADASALDELQGHRGELRGRRLELRQRSGPRVLHPDPGGQAPREGRGSAPGDRAARRGPAPAPRGLLAEDGDPGLPPRHEEPSRRHPRSDHRRDRARRRHRHLGEDRGVRGRQPPGSARGHLLHLLRGLREEPLRRRPVGLVPREPREVRARLRRCPGLRHPGRHPRAGRLEDPGDGPGLVLRAGHRHDLGQQGRLPRVER